MEKVREMVKEVPVEKVKEVIKEVVKQVPVEKIKEVVKEVPKIKEVPVEVVKQVLVEVVKEVPVDKVKVVVKEVPVERVKVVVNEVPVERVVVKEVPVKVVVEKVSSGLNRRFSQWIQTGTLCSAPASSTPAAEKEPMWFCIFADRHHHAGSNRLQWFDVIQIGFHSKALPSRWRASNTSRALVRTPFKRSLGSWWRCLSTALPPRVSPPSDPPSTAPPP